MQYQIEIFLSSLNQFWVELVHFVPKLLAAMVILFFGWLVAKAVRIGVKRILELTHFDTFAQKSGLETFMRSANYKVTLSGIISQVVYWLVILLFVITGANSLGLYEVAALLKELASYLPHIIVAILVVIFGTLFARFINRLVFAWLHSIKFDQALVISTSAEYCIQILAIFIALEQLGIGMQLIHSLFVIVFGAVFLALAIAFGLGGRDWAAKVIDQAQQKKK
ncbi:mechanosensitive ion channel family protein [Methylophilus sp. 3sh_L]|uniref:mechanosensitive ion channel family protein n=1 Tax=Methylophilus sp. 3sh_L TaxID=3377114 RepID=UPI00398E5DBE